MKNRIEPPSAEDIEAGLSPTGQTDANLLRIMAEDESTLDAAAVAIARTSTAKKKPAAAAVKEQLEGIADRVDESF